MLKVIVTGANSMMGRSITSALTRNNYDVVKLTHENCDLLSFEQTYNFFKKHQPQFCVHCAGFNGNIDFNSKYPANIFQETAQIGINTLKVCNDTGVFKVLSLISSCAYPDNKQELLVETEFWNGEPNPTVDAHGFSKRILMEYGRQLHKQFKLIHVGMVVNTGYGPYDNYDINKTKVVGGLITKFVNAKKNNEDVVCWGTGSPRREFIFCEDVGHYARLVLENYTDVDYPINIGSGVDYSIKDLVEYIKDEVGFTGNVIWDTKKPDGQRKKLLDNTKMKKLFGEHEHFTPLKTGIKQTVNWYESKVICDSSRD